MDINLVPPGIAFTCDSNGVIKNVFLNGLGVKGLIEGQRIENVIDSGSRSKLLNFLVELRSKGAAINWEVNILCEDLTETIQLSGVSQKNVLMVLGVRDNKDALFMCGEFMKINNEQTTLLRTALKERIQSNINATTGSDSSYDDMSRLNNELVTLQRDLVKKNIELERLNHQIQEISLLDSLTGQYNRRGLFEMGEFQVAQALRYKRPLSAIMFDVDKFKSINDRYGHIVGDQVLALLIERCHQQLRKVDILGRYGGDEFVILLPETNEEGAMIVADRLLRSVNLPMEIGELSLLVTISMGIAGVKTETADLETLLNCADRGLYKAKESGRDCVCVDQA
jgi:diguanylate cyclase (GGDEF)-like protein